MDQKEDEADIFTDETNYADLDQVATSEDDRKMLEKLDHYEKLLLAPVKTKLYSFFINALDTYKVYTLSTVHPSLLSNPQAYIKEGNYTEAYPMIVIHGMGGASAFWSANIDDLASLGFPLFIIDLPGFGKSTRFALKEKTVKAVCDLYTSIIYDYTEKIFAKKVVILAHPDKVHKLIFVDPWGFADEKEDLINSLRKNSFHQFTSFFFQSELYFRIFSKLLHPFSILKVFRAMGPEITIKTIQKYRGDFCDKYSIMYGLENARHIIPSYFFYYNGRKMATSEEIFYVLTTLLCWAKDSMAKKFIESNLDIKMHFIYGSKSWISPLTGLRIRNSMADRVSVDLIDDADHQVHTSNPKQFLNSIYNFLKKDSVKTKPELFKIYHLSVNLNPAFRQSQYTVNKGMFANMIRAVARRTLANKTFMEPEEAAALCRTPLTSSQVAAWKSRLLARDPASRVAPVNRFLPADDYETPTFYLTVASSYRNTLDHERHYDNVLQALQPDAVVLAVEDEFREYVTSFDPRVLCFVNSSVFKTLKKYFKKGPFLAEYERIIHETLDYMSLSRNSLPYKNFATVLEKAKFVNGCQVYSGFRMGYNEMGLSLGNLPQDLKLQSLFYFFASKLIINKDYHNPEDREHFTNAFRMFYSYPFYPLDLMAKTCQLSGSIQHIYAGLNVAKDKFNSVNKEKGGSSGSVKAPVILVVAQPYIADVLRGYKKFNDTPTHELDREELDLFEVPIDFVERFHQDDTEFEFAKRVKETAFNIPPLQFNLD